MFDNVAFNVVIGLVFVYLLYSLLVTILSEMLAGWCGIRARLLRLSIERMLNDGETTMQNRWNRFTLQPSTNFEQSFAGMFYEYPTIKFLSKSETRQNRWFAQTKPSYISEENFADTL